MGELGQTTTTKGNDQELLIKKILIAVDKSEYTDKIIKYGLRLAKSLRAEVTAVHVIDRSSLGIIGELLAYYRGGKIEVYEEALRKKAKEFLGEAELLAKEEGVQINTEVIMNEPSAAEGIVNYASRTSTDLIVIGTKGMTGAQKFLMGGVANKVASHAHCSVLAVR